MDDSQKPTVRQPEGWLALRLEPEPQPTLLARLLAALLLSWFVLVLAIGAALVCGHW